jgi:regulator of PEP synthase PpsR (kinase-PPPase family)
MGELPENDLGRLHQVDEAYDHRIEAMEFALLHDDGLGLATLREAEAVIVGVSRVSKSPTMLFLASRGYKVANVSIAPETGLPDDLTKISQKKIVALTTRPNQLLEIRKERAVQMGLRGAEYDDLQAVIREVVEAEAEYRRRGWPVIDVTNVAIEQTAARIIEILRLPTR